MLLDLVLEASREDLDRNLRDKCLEAFRSHPVIAEGDDHEVRAFVSKLTLPADSLADLGQMVVDLVIRRRAALEAERRMRVLVQLDVP